MNRPDYPYVMVGMLLLASGFMFSMSDVRLGCAIGFLWFARAAERAWERDADLWNRKDEP